MTPAILHLAQAVVQQPPEVPIGRYLRWNGEVKASELLTTISVLISFFALVAALWKDIQTRRSSDADRIRSAAAHALSKQERWKTLTLWYYQDVQPLFVETSDLLAEQFDVDKARDYLWKALAAARIKSAERVVNESIETAYVELASFYPNMYDLLKTALRDMGRVDEERYRDFVDASQMSVLKYRDHQEDYMPARLGNDLRGVCGLTQSLLHEQISTISDPIGQFLVGVIKQTDLEILARKRKAFELPRLPQRQFPTLLEHIKAAASTAVTAPSPRS